MQNLKSKEKFCLKGTWVLFIPKIPETKVLNFLRKYFSQRERRKKEREKNAVNSGHLVPRKRTQAARTNNRPQVSYLSCSDGRTHFIQTNNYDCLIGLP